MPMIKPQVSSSNPIAELTNIANELLASGRGRLSVEDAGAVYSSENFGSLNESVAQRVKNDMDVIKERIRSLAIAAGDSPFTKQRVTAAMEGFMAGANINAYKKQSYDLHRLAPAGSVVSIDGQGDMAANRSYSSEAFEEATSRQVAAWSTSYNFMMPGQDPVIEMFYPTIVLAADQMGICVQTQLHQFWSGIVRNPTGVAETFKRRNIMDTLVNPELLKNNQSTCYAIATADKDPTLVAPVSEVPATKEQIGTVDKFETLDTTALVAGKRINLLTLGATPGLLANAVLSQKDTLHHNVVLKELFIRFGAGADAELLFFNVSRLATTHAVFATQGSTQDMTINFESNALTISAKSLKSDRKTLSVKQAANTNVIRFSLRVSASVNLERGDIELTGYRPVFIEALDSTGKVVTDQAVIDASRTLAESGVVAYYNVDAKRTLSNRRQIGNLVDSTSYFYVLGVPLHPPVCSIRPISDDVSRQNEDVASLVQMTQVQMGAAGFKELFDNFEYLKAASTGGMSQDLYNPQIGGQARYFHHIAIVDQTLDIKDLVLSLDSASRVTDVRHAVVNALRAPIAQAVQDSRMIPAAQFQGRSGKIRIKIATDVKTAELLQLQGDVNLFGDGYEYQIATTLVENMRNVLMIGLCPADAPSGDEYDVQGTGHTLVRPEVVWAMDRQVDGDVAKVMAVQPSYRHVSNGVVWLRFTLTNVNQAIADKLAYQVHQA